jgi:hypothetical protein
MAGTNPAVDLERHPDRCVARVPPVRQRPIDESLEQCNVGLEARDQSRAFQRCERLSQALLALEHAFDATAHRPSERAWKPTVHLGDPAYRLPQDAVDP